VTSIFDITRKKTPQHRLFIMGKLEMSPCMNWNPYTTVKIKKPAPVALMHHLMGFENLGFIIFRPQKAAA